MKFVNITPGQDENGWMLRVDDLRGFTAKETSAGLWSIRCFFADGSTFDLPAGGREETAVRWDHFLAVLR